jgi:Xaa-Pro aminopeptidase
MYGFETLTFAPIDTRMIVKDLLDAGETDWLNNYHREVRIRLTPLVSPATAAWLEVATAPI